VSQKVLILRDPSTRLTIFKEYMVIKNILNDYIISFSHIETIYLSKSISIDIATCYKLSQKVPLFIIDHDGYILAELKRFKDA